MNKNAHITFKWSDTYLIFCNSHLLDEYCPTSSWQTGIKFLYIKQGHFIPSSHQLSLQVGKITNQKSLFFILFFNKSYIFDRAQVRRLRWPTNMWHLISMLPILRFTEPMTRSIVILEVSCIVTKMFSYNWPNIVIKCLNICLRVHISKNECQSSNTIICQTTPYHYLNIWRHWQYSPNIPVSTFQMLFSRPSTCHQA